MKTYKLFESIELIEGYNRVLLFDSLRQEFYFLPKKVVDNLYINRKTNEIDPKNPLFNFLYDNELIFSINHRFVKNFPEINKYWETVYPLDNILYFVNDSTIQHLKKLINIDKFGQIHFIFNSQISDATLNKVFKLIEFIYCDTIKITDEDGLNSTQISTIIEQINIKINRQIILNGISKHYVNRINRDGVFIDNKKSIYDKLTYSFDDYYEAQEHHTYFNKKLTIDGKGNILNDYKDKADFGNIKNIETFGQLLKIANREEFKKKWHLKKSNTDVCKVCEFRFNCIDARQPYERGGSVYHKIECNYNPYICKWKGEEGYRPLSECGVISNDEGLSINHEKIAKINTELWSEE